MTAAMTQVPVPVTKTVFTTSANASTTPQEKQGTKLEIRVKTRPNGDKQEQKQEQNKDQKQEQKQENTDVVSKIIQKFGVRVK